MYQGSGSADWQMGANDIRFGADVRVFNSVIGNFGSASGTFGYSSLQRFLLDLPPDVGGQQTFGGTSFIGNRTLVHPFVQDSFRFHGWILNWTRLRIRHDSGKSSAAKRAERFRHSWFDQFGKPSTDT
jgi:hypothetical protein